MTRCGPTKYKSPINFNLVSLMETLSTRLNRFGQLGASTLVAIFIARWTSGTIGGAYGTHIQGEAASDRSGMMGSPMGARGDDSPMGHEVPRPCSDATTYIRIVD